MKYLTLIHLDKRVRVIDKNPSPWFFLTARKRDAISNICR
jgi:hypothetical protein